MPSYNDWTSCARLIEELDHVLHDKSNQRYEVLVIDDGSPETPYEQLPGEELRSIDAVSVLRLKRNLGHQRAICIGLAYIQKHYPCTVVILLDSDGEDAPEDVPKLLDQFETENQQYIVFAKRIKRSERLFFRFFLQIYKLIHLTLTGKGISIGNFSVIPHSLLQSLAVMPELWNNYAASVLHSRLPHLLVPTRRAKRLDGSSKMNFTALVIHGLSAISVFSDVVGVRLLIASSGLIGLLFLSIASIFSVRFITDQAIQEWAAFTGGLLLVILLQVILFTMIFSFLILNGRKNAGFIPARDYLIFIDRLVDIWRKS